MAKPPLHFSPTKLTPPRLHKILERNHLYDLLDQQRTQHRILWLYAPPGSGKTTLLASYARRQCTQTVWYQIDKGDADPGTLFYYLGLAIKKAAPRFRKPLPTLSPDYWPSLHGFTRRFFEVFFSRLKPPSLMVLDNIHNLPEQALTHDLLQVAVQSIPEGMTIVVISRTEPPAAYADLRVKHTMGVVASGVLALTRQETEALTTLRGAPERGVVLQKKAQRILVRTKGWMAGTLLLLAQSDEAELTSSPERTPSITPLLFDYLAREVLMRQPPTHQDILLKTALFPSFTPTMAKQITGQTKAPTMLAKLARNHYFIERRPGTNGVYQYHPLFRDFLRDYAERTWQPTQVQETQINSAEFLVKAGWVEEGIELLLNACQYERAIPLILEQAPLLLAQGRVQTLESWMRQLPPPVVANTPWIGFWMAQCRLWVHPNEGVAVFNEIFPTFQHRNDVVGMLLTGCGAIQAISASMIDWTRLDPWIDCLPKLIEDNENLLNKEITTQVICAIFSAMAHRCPHHPQTLEWERKARACVKTIPDPTQQAFVMNHLCLFQFCRGNLRQASQLLQGMDGWIHSETVSPTGRILLAHNHAMQAWAQGDGKSCEKIYETARKITINEGVEHLLGWVMTEGVTGALLNDDRVRARRLLEEVKPKMEHAPGAIGSPYHHMAGIFAHLNNDYMLARGHFETGLGLVESFGVDFLRGLFIFSLGELCIDQGDFVAGEEQMTRIHHLAQHNKSATLSFYGLWLEAHLAFSRVQIPEGQQALQRLFKLGQSMGIRYQLGLQPFIMAQLCAKALEYGIEEDYARVLIRTHHLRAPIDCSITPWPAFVQINTLGAFSILSDNTPVLVGKKIPKRPFALLKTIIVLGGRQVPVAKLLEWLWPDSDGDRAYRSFLTTLRRTRLLLGHPDSMPLSGNLVSLNPRMCWVDSLDFAQCVEQALLARKQDNRRQSLKYYERAALLYQGPFLPEDEQKAWTIHRRDRLEAQFHQMIEHMREDYEKTGQWKQAIDLLDRVHKHTRPTTPPSNPPSVS